MESLEVCLKLSERLYRIIAEQYSPDLVVGILGGGFLPAVEVAKLFGVPVGFIDIKAYCGGKVIHTHLLEHDLRTLDVLLIDDVWHYGHTMTKARKLIKDYNPKCLRTGILGFVDESPFYHNLPDFSASRRDVGRLTHQEHSSHNDYLEYLFEKSQLPEFRWLILAHFHDILAHRYPRMVHLP